MTLTLITVICTKCGEELHLPQHVADLPADARLCAVCVRALLLLAPQGETERRNLCQ